MKPTTTLEPGFTMVQKFAAQSNILQLAAIAILAAACMPAVRVAAQGPPAPVSAARIILDTPKVQRAFVGTVLPLRTTIIGSAVDGRVLEFPLRPGDIVEAGGAVTQLKTDTIEREIAIAKSETSLRAAELSEMQRNEISDISAAKVASAQARLKFSESKRDRYAELYKNNTIREEEYQLVLTEALEARAALEAMQAEHQNMTKGTQVDKIAQARARTAIASEMVALLETKKRKHTLISPFRGIVTATHTEVGAWLSKGAPAVEVVDLEQVEIEFGVQEQYIARVNVGTPATLHFNALPGQTFTAPVTSVVPRADVKTRTFPVRIRVNNKANAAGVRLFRAGMYCTVRIDATDVQRALVPKDALVLNKDTTLIYVIHKTDPKSLEGTVRLMPVTVGPGSGQYVQVSGPTVSSLTKNDLVVTGGNERLRPGQAVRHLERLSTYSKK